MQSREHLVKLQGNNFTKVLGAGSATKGRIDRTQKPSGFVALPSRALFDYQPGGTRENRLVGDGRDRPLHTISDCVKNDLYVLRQTQT
jgi:hypothetical protein